MESPHYEHKEMQMEHPTLSRPAVSLRARRDSINVSYSYNFHRLDAHLTLPSGGFQALTLPRDEAVKLADVCCGVLGYTTREEQFLPVEHVVTLNPGTTTAVRTIYRDKGEAMAEVLRRMTAGQHVSFHSEHA